MFLNSVQQHLKAAWLHLPQRVVQQQFPIRFRILHRQETTSQQQKIFMAEPTICQLTHQYSMVLKQHLLTHLTLTRLRLQSKIIQRLYLLRHQEIRTQMLWILRNWQTLHMLTKFHWQLTIHLLLLIWFARLNTVLISWYIPQQNSSVDMVQLSVVSLQTAVSLTGKQAANSLL